MEHLPGLCNTIDSNLQADKEGGRKERSNERRKEGEKGRREGERVKKERLLLTSRIEV